MACRLLGEMREVNNNSKSHSYQTSNAKESGSQVRVQKQVVVEKIVGGLDIETIKRS